jgi:CheY-like chemotaxis protein
LGCKVIEYQDAYTALEFLQTSPSLDVIFTDVDMPDINGLQFLEQAQAINSDIPVVVTSILPHPDLYHLALVKGAAECLFEQHTQDDFKRVLEKLCPQKFVL